jgi:hypothetical protein
VGKALYTLLSITVKVREDLLLEKQQNPYIVLDLLEIDIFLNYCDFDVSLFCFNYKFKIKKVRI